ncbi:stress responsive A/B barrel domain protein [Penicillium concentricum]|uniref:Stress responsive A/B barrel domain protein n=1 Tax=Penicillium concentricum TaxID=293559 RepID=A0A9W9RRZ5_9EURO|nr:stress responsive A/B barrel domain protein [Penicillium concentricum]KAJ5365281.1 stress responsive A/B barrel domain protein [Penicillium concentricum]
MTVAHIVLIKFRPEVAQEHKDNVIREIQKMKEMNSIKGRSLVVGASITVPMERSKGFEIALVSFHENKTELEKYRNSEEHHRITSTSIYPFQDESIRFDFEVAPEDDFLLNILSLQDNKKQ